MFEELRKELSQAKREFSSVAREIARDARSTFEDAKATLQETAREIRETFKDISWEDVTREACPDSADKTSPTPAQNLREWSSEEFCAALKLGGATSQPWSEIPDIISYAAFEKYFAQLQTYSRDNNEYAAVVAYNVLDAKLFKQATVRGTNSRVSFYWDSSQGSRATGNVPVLLMHSHPPDSTHLHFSDEDIANFLNPSLRFQASVVVIGHKRLMMVRTPRTPLPVSVSEALSVIKAKCRQYPELNDLAPHSRIQKSTLWGCRHFNIELYVSNSRKDLKFRRMKISEK